MRTRSVTFWLLLAYAFLLSPSRIHAQITDPAGHGSFSFEDGMETLFRGGYWDTPEGKARYEQLQWERFDQNLDRLKRLGEADWVGGSSPDGTASGELEVWAKDLDNVSDDMSRFLEWKFAGERLDPLATDDSLKNRLARIAPKVWQILETVSVLREGDMPILEFVQMQQNLADLHALGRALRD